MIKANYEETGDSVRVVHLGVGEGQGFSQKGVQPSFGRNTRKIHLIFYNFIRENIPSGWPVFDVWLKAWRGVLNKVI